MKAKLEKICLDSKCQESWAEMPDDVRRHAASFTYCPLCSEELHIQCSSCNEALGDTQFRFCPWCGAEFEK